MTDVNEDPRRIEYLPLAEIRGADLNPKAHDIATIAASVRERGFVEPPAPDARTNRLVAGHGRLEALAGLKADGANPPAGLKVRELDGEWLVPIVVGWRSRNDADAAAYLVASNRLTEIGGWDDEALTSLLSSINASGPDALIGTGYSTDDIDRMLNEANIAAAGDVDDIPDPKKIWVKSGDLFALGDHRIWCGDSTKKEALKVLDGEPARCVWTDPPYGVEYKGTAGSILNDDAAGLPKLLAGAFKTCFEAMADGAHIYVAHPAGALSLVFYDAFREAGFKFKQQLVWDKGALVLGHSDYHYRHEPIIYGMKQGSSTGRRGRGGNGWYGDNAQTSVLEYPKPKRSEEHPTMKPVELVEHCLKNSTAPKHRVFEPFSGSGTTLLACERLGRRCGAVELDPKFVQVAIERWEAFTKKKAKKLK